MKKNIIRRILSKIKFLVKSFIFSRKYKKYKKYCKKKEQVEFLIFNTPIHGNIGDHAIAYAEYKILEKIKIKAFEIPTNQERYYFDYIKKNISDDAIISITGGGFIGSQWLIEEKLVNKVINQFKNHKIIIFPQTIYFKDDEQGKIELKKSIDIYDEAKDLNIFARENKTYEFAKSTYKNANVILIPDIVLSLENKEMGYTRDGILICMRKDAEGLFSEKDKENLENALKKYDKNIKKTDTVVNYNIKIENRNIEIENKLKEFASSKLVITDRLHGMIFATITNTPCIVFSNYNYKVEGVYQWIKEVDKNIVFETDINNIEEKIKILLENKVEKNKDNCYNFEKLYKILEGK